MSELKAFNCVDSDLQEFCEPQLVYLKSEADKAIAEKDAKILALDAEVFKEKHHAKLFFDERNYAEAQLRHHKYKRCLAMAMWCFTKSNYHFVLARHGEDAKKNNRKSILYSKWHKRWLKLAEKYKEGNV